jgi:hypothetical protein
MYRKYEQCFFMKTILNVDEMYNSVTKNYRNCVVIKLLHIALLPEGCLSVEAGGTTANTKREPAGRSQQPSRPVLRV